MKRLFCSCCILATLSLVSCQFDDTEIWNKLKEYGETIKEHEKRIASLEELCMQINTNIESLQVVINTLKKHDYITYISPIKKDGVEVGYTISFAYHDTITIYHGQNGTNGQDGYTPNISVKQDVDGIYYWTIDGQWLLDENGNKIKAVGTDGKDGQDGHNGVPGKDGIDGTDGVDGADGKDGNNGADGKDGINGVDGKDGITPRLKIENGYWYISYDEGATWTELGKATGEDGKDGADGSDGVDGANGDNIFSSVTQDDEYVYFTLADGTMITLPKHDKENIQFEDLQVKAICCKNWDTNNDGELSYAEAAAVTTIGTKFKGSSIIAFNELKYFTGITEIPDEAFSGCSSLWKIIIPNNIVTIADSAFDNCNSIVNFIGKFSSDDNKYLIIDGRLIAYARGYNESTCIIPEGTSIITSNTFKNLSKLESITFPNSLTEIHSQAFYNCDNLTDVTITSATSIGEKAFKDCDKLVTATIDATTISIEAFNGCDSLKIVTIGPNITLIDKNAFYPCENITHIYCEALAPPAIFSTSYTNGYSTFPNHYKGYSIYVPISAVDRYTNISVYSAVSGECVSGNWYLYDSIIKPFDFENNQEVE